ncbi:MAG: hypothetical protein LBV72_17045 [Tannerella sp.]|nr:hypothetical protein [Tannerella sp.]
MKHDTISFILEDDILVIDSLKFEKCEAFHRTSTNPEVSVYVSMSSRFPSDKDRDPSGATIDRYRVSFDLIGVNPKKFNAEVYFNSQTHILHYPN